MCTRKGLVGSIALFISIGLAASVKASVVELATWQPVPNSSLPEINYTAAGLQTGAGAIGNGDGNLPVQSQTPGGLETDTIVNAPIPFSFNSSVFTGGTGYYDTTLTFSGLAPVGPATQTTIVPGIIQDTQLLGPGSFSLTSTAPAGSLPLITGIISGATLVTGVDGGNSGAVFNADGITYTGGVIISALPATAVLAGNDMSISMTAITPAFGVSGTAPFQLNPFTAAATGLFDINETSNVVPEPGTLALAIFGVGALGLRRRRTK